MSLISILLLLLMILKLCWLHNVLHVVVLDLLLMHVAPSITSYLLLYAQVRTWLLLLLLCSHNGISREIGRLLVLLPHLFNHASSSLLQLHMVMGPLRTPCHLLLRLLLDKQLFLKLLEMLLVLSVTTMWRG